MNMPAFVTPPLPALPPWGRLRTGALVFAALTVAGLVGLFAFGARAGAPLRLADLRVEFLLLALASALADVLLGGLRMQIFIRRIRPRSPLGLPIRADLAGRFIGAVTPSQTGGGPAQVFVLHRGGIPVGEALSFLLVNLISALLVLLLAGGLSAWFVRRHLGEGVLPGLFQYGFFVVLALLAVMVAALLRPELVSRPLERLARRPGRDGARHPTSLQRIAGLVADSLEQFRVACRRFVRESPWLPAASFALAALACVNKFGLAWLVMRGLGIERDFALTVALVALASFCVYLVPSPGSSGIAELATGALLASLVPGPLLGPFTLVYRLLSAYLPAAAGACLLLAELGRGRASARARPAPALGLVLVLSLGAAGASAESGTPCLLCGGEALETTPLLRAEVEAVAERLAARNRRNLGRIDSLLRAGRLGPPESREARARAQLLARMTLENWYSFLLPFVSDPERVRVVQPEAIAPVASRFCEAIAVPMPRLRELRVGRGLVCARYDLGGSPEESWTVFGGRRLRYRVGDRAVGGRVRRVLGLDWPSASMGRIEVLVEEHYGFRLVDIQSSDEGTPCDLFLALDVSGAWVRRHGVHRPAAFAFWATRPSDEAPFVPRRPRVGSALYLPGLRFRLPLLPDVELDDVRALALPMPFLDAEDLRRGVLPSWLPTEGDMGLCAWTSEGPLPPALRAYFPEHGGAARASSGVIARTVDRDSAAP